MSYTKSGKGLYWKPQETVEVQFLEVFHLESDGKGATAPVVGLLHFEHFVQGQMPVQCGGGPARCKLCKDKNKAVAKYNLRVFAEGMARYADINSSLAKMIGDKQKMLKELGTGDVDIMNTVYRIKKLGKDRPFWTVDVVGRKSLPADVVTGPISREDLERMWNGSGQAQTKSLDLNQMVSEPAAAGVAVPAPAAGTTMPKQYVKISASDVEMLKKFEPALASFRATTPDIDIPGSIAQSLRGKEGWTAEKIETAITMFTNDGRLQVNAELVAA